MRTNGLRTSRGREAEGQHVASRMRELGQSSKQLTCIDERLLHSDAQKARPSPRVGVIEVSQVAQRASSGDQAPECRSVLVSTTSLDQTLVDPSREPIEEQRPGCATLDRRTENLPRVHAALRGLRPDTGAAQDPRRRRAGRSADQHGRAGMRRRVASANPAAAHRAPPSERASWCTPRQEALGTFRRVSGQAEGEGVEASVLGPVQVPRSSWPRSRPPAAAASAAPASRGRKAQAVSGIAEPAEERGRQAAAGVSSGPSFPECGRSCSDAGSTPGGCPSAPTVARVHQRVRASSSHRLHVPRVPSKRRERDQEGPPEQDAGRGPPRPRRSRSSSRGSRLDEEWIRHGGQGSTAPATVVNLAGQLAENRADGGESGHELPALASFCSVVVSALCALAACRNGHATPPGVLLATPNSPGEPEVVIDGQDGRGMATPCAWSTSKRGDRAHRGHGSSSRGLRAAGAAACARTRGEGSLPRAPGRRASCCSRRTSTSPIALVPGSGRLFGLAVRPVRLPHSPSRRVPAG